MLKTLLVTLAIALASSTPFLSSASFASSQTPNFLMIDSGNYRLSDFVNLTSNDLANITGRKMKIFERISFNALKLDMKRILKKEPNISVSEYYSSKKSKRMGAGWIFVISFFGLLLILFLVFIIAMSNWH
jgi:hypothetical protein